MRVCLCVLLLSACVGADKVSDDGTRDTDVVAADLYIHDDASLHAAAGIVHLGGSLWIDASAVSDVDELSSLERVDGSVTVTGGGVLTSLQGLSSLTRVGRDLRLTDATALVRLDGLEALEEIGGAWSLQGLLGLRDLRALVALERVEGLVAFHRLPALRSLTCAPNLKEVHGLSVEDLPGLLLLDGPGTPKTRSGGVVLRDSTLSGVPWFKGITHVQGTLQLAQLPQLSQLGALSSLEMVDGDLLLDDLPVLTSITPLGGVHTIHGWLTLSRAPEIVQIVGESALASVEGVLIEGLSSLVRLADWPLLKEIPGTLRLSDLPALVTLELPALERVDVLMVQRLTALSDLSGLRPHAVHGLGIYGNTRLVQLGWEGDHVAVDGWITLDRNGLRTLGGAHFDGALADYGPDAPDATLVVTNNYLLSDLLGLDGITSARGRVTLRDVDQALDLSGLQNLTSSGPVEVSGAPLLESLAGLEGLRQVSGAVSVFNNKRLNDVSALGSLVEADAVVLRDLPALCSLSVDALRDALGEIVVDTTRVTCPEPSAR